MHHETLLDSAIQGAGIILVMVAIGFVIRCIKFFTKKPNA